VKLTAVFEPAAEGGITRFIQEAPAAISEGEALAEAKAPLLNTPRLVLRNQREQVAKNLALKSVRDTLEFPGLRFGSPKPGLRNRFHIVR
jgi:hypothetical protein